MYTIPKEDGLQEQIGVRRGVASRKRERLATAGEPGASATGGGAVPEKRL
jgi:hypothetical protein